MQPVQYILIPTSIVPDFAESFLYSLYTGSSHYTRFWRFSDGFRGSLRVWEVLGGLGGLLEGFEGSWRVLESFVGVRVLEEGILF